MRVETSDGIVGWGEGTLEGHTEAVEGAFQDLRERFLGYDADNIQDIWQTAYRGRFYRGGPVLMVDYFAPLLLFEAQHCGSYRAHYQAWTSRCGTSRAKSWEFLSGSCSVAKYGIACGCTVGSVVITRLRSRLLLYDVLGRDSLLSR